MHRFTAKLERLGPNAKVEVPERVSRALKSHARSGRVRVDGTVNGTRFRATLVPVRGGRHRLFVTQALRRTAGLEVGDTARFALTAASAKEPAPPDVAAGLRRAKGAKAAFDALAPSHRRELLRYIDDARTHESRKKRIQQTADHVLGRRPPTSRGRRGKPLWSCPRCGHEFVNKNQYHSCKRYRLEDVFAGKGEEVRRLFERFRRMVESCGPVKILAYRDHVGFMVRVRFASATPRAKALDIGFWLPRRIASPRLRKVETLTANAHVHSLRIHEEGEIDDELAGWIRDACAVGCQEHLASPGG